MVRCVLTDGNVTLSIPSAYTHPATHPASMITGLATVATSGSYNDLSNKPTIISATSVMPDYSAGVTKSTSTTGWTAPSDGFAFIGSGNYSTKTGYYYYYVNGVTVIKLENSAHLTHAPITIPLAKGDVLTFSDPQKWCEFYPCKAVN